MTTQQGTLRPAVSVEDHVLGPADAPVTLVEYGDFQCPHCARAHRVLPKVLKRLGDRTRFVFRHFPLGESHPDAIHAAEASESVAAQVGEEGFWRMHDLMYDHQRDGDDSLDDAHLIRYAGQAGATRLAISRALLQVDANLRGTLKAEGLLRRDPRMKERKKSGQPGARKRFQFSKR